MQVVIIYSAFKTIACASHFFELELESQDQYTLLEQLDWVGASGLGWGPVECLGASGMDWRQVK